MAINVRVRDAVAMCRAMSKVYWIVNGDTRISNTEFRDSLKRQCKAILKDMEQA